MSPVTVARHKFDWWLLQSFEAALFHCCSSPILPVVGATSEDGPQVCRLEKTWIPDMICQDLSLMGPIKLTCGTLLQCGESV